MTRWLIVLVALFLASAASPAAAASFDCAKARTQVEKLICGDPELSRQDEALNAAYISALQNWNGRIAAYTRLTQQRWARSRTLVPEGYGVGGQPCDDDKDRLPCLRGMYRDRIAALSTPAWRLGGVYERGKDMIRLNVTAGGLELGYMLANADASQGFTPDGKQVAVAPGADKVAFVLTGTGRDACRLDGAFTAEAMTITQQGPCGGQSLAGRWVRNQTRDPVDELF